MLPCERNSPVTGGLHSMQILGIFVSLNKLFTNNRVAGEMESTNAQWRHPNVDVSTHMDSV